MKSIKELIDTRMEPLVKVARKIGVSRQTLYNAMNGKKISFVALKLICDYFKADYKEYL